jgi:hypothetical protein
MRLCDDNQVWPQPVMDHDLEILRIEEVRGSVTQFHTDSELPAAQDPTLVLAFVYPS